MRDLGNKVEVMIMQFLVFQIWNIDNVEPVSEEAI